MPCTTDSNCNSIGDNKKARFIARMKNLPALVGILIGSLIGLFTTISDELGLKIVMISIGALAGAAVGMAISRMRRQEKKSKLNRVFFPGTELFPGDRASTYWRDKGRIYPMPGHPDPEGVTRDPADLL